MKSKLQYILIPVFAFLISGAAFSQTDTTSNTSPLIFKNGMAQAVPEFSDPKTWIKEELWVETTFDSDNDGKPDRMHTYVTRPALTQTTNLKLPVVYMPSPYYGLKLWALLCFRSAYN